MSFCLKRFAPIFVGLGIVLSLACASAPGGTSIHGKTVKIPPPSGMSKLDHNETRPGKVVLGMFAADSTLQRWRSQGLSGPLPFYALASAWLKGNTDARSAAALIEARRHSELGLGDPAMTTEWAMALQSALAGQHGPLPAMPEGIVRIGQVQTPASECIMLVAMRDGQKSNLLGSAVVLAGSRAVDLDVVLHQPTDCAELVLVRSTLLSWAAAIRDSNP